MRTVQDKPKPIITTGLVLGIVLIIGFVAILVSVGIVGYRAQAAEDEQKKKDDEAKAEADKKKKEQEEKEKEEEKKEKEKEKEKEEREKKPQELEWIGGDSYCSVNGKPNIGILASTWVDGKPGLWDHMRLTFKIEDGQSLESTLLSNWKYRSDRRIRFNLVIKSGQMAAGVTRLLKTRFSKGLAGTTLSPANYVLSDWALSIVTGDQLVLDCTFSVEAIISGLGREQPSVLFDADNIRAK